ncbi:alpha/beta fold hydrolase [Dyadobacter chenwenxiniae]|uniref:Alpha/beta fold hydrolase n=1 Tax=Dyadobacter chenwenxiniae TaxID=2906456 RepID=A0A9X1TLX5_9BACT|nr:alpha/beta fold hydrolase [Dyadobacter chenwenxiniae]MCF0062833.1 alpha/beta fold hydrolase [Dyadobacter chenwenxiniae]UON84992.1 alpha/beta fold hydrolase [Dyadobacter chenwenxiniae]
MKKLIFILSIAFSSLAYGQQQHARTFLFVPGAWDGGWDYAKVDSILTANGDRVYRPTLTGLGERVHLSRPGINLTTYINDILNLIRFENLHNVILVGHSYGGMVISGVAERVPDRIRQLVYLDAMVPNNGESAKDICGDLWGPMIKDSVFVYPFGFTKAVPPGDVPQPLGTFTEPIQIGNPLVKKIPAVFILMTKEGKSSPEHDKMGLLRAKARNWKIFTFEGGHYSMREQPENLVKKLKEVTQP